MAKYEMLTLIISCIAIITSIAIPLAGHIYRKLQKPKLDIYEFEHQPLTVMYSTLGNRIRFNFSILCQNAPCVVRSIEAEVFHEASGELMRMRWVIMEPVRSDWANGMGSIINLNSMTPAHPLLIDANALVPLSVHFEPLDNSAFHDAYNRRLALGDVELPETLEKQRPSDRFDGLPHAGGIDALMRQLKELCFWDHGRYRLRVRLIYDANKSHEKDFYFDLAAEESDQLRSNAKKLLLCEVCPRSSNPVVAQCISIAKDVEK
ncbi:MULTISPECIES: hypothetical protein [unclassified Adlercreutzia]|uniref:hypothetical protein n=1 Tax=unclassified Adlercreutzia TaxID=2636013 RepID=UPI0013EB8656|nr:MULTISPECIES: hypothetical protein [unclassified Adlercreutzia]